MARLTVTMTPDRTLDGSGSGSGPFDAIDAMLERLGYPRPFRFSTLDELQRREQERRARELDERLRAVRGSLAA